MLKLPYNSGSGQSSALVLRTDPAEIKTFQSGDDSQWV